MTRIGNLSWWQRPIALAVLFAMAIACTPTTPEATPGVTGKAGELATPAKAADPGSAGKPSTTTDTAKRGGTLRTVSRADANSFHPFKTTDTASSEYQGYQYGISLIRYDATSKDLDKVPDASTGWTISEDKKTYTFTLKDNLQWSDGKPITSADFVWTFEQANNPANKFPYRSNFENIESYTGPDPKTIVVKVKEPTVVDLEVVDAVSPLPKHIWEKLDWNDNPEIQKPTVGSGSFLLKEWQRDNHALFVANEKYHRGRPNIDQLVVRIVPNPTIGYQMLKTGEADVSSFSQQDYKEAKTVSNINVYEWWPAAATWYYMGFNLRKPHFQDIKVRQALAYAMNRKPIIENVFQGLAREQFGPYPQSSWVANENLPKYDFSLDKAKQLLDEAGWRAGAQGLRAKDGQPLKLRVLYPTSSKPREQIATIAQQQFKELGIQADIQGLEFQAFLAETKKEPFNWDIEMGAWRSTVEPHFMYQIWSKESIPDLNSVGYVNERVEQLFKQGEREFDRAKRKTIYQEIQKLIADDLPYIFLTADKSFEGVSKKVQGIKETPLGIDYNLHEWWIQDK